MTLVLLAGPGAAPPPRDLAALLLTGRDLPARYVAASADPYAFFLDVLFDHPGAGGGPCRLPMNRQRSVNAVFVTRDKYALDVESLTEVLAEPGPRAAADLVHAVAAMPARCPRIETPNSSIAMEPIPLPGAAGRASALRVRVSVKAAGTPNAYVDSLDAEISVSARGGLSAGIVLMGYFERHAVGLARVTRTAVRKLGEARTASAP